MAALVGPDEEQMGDLLRQLVPKQMAHRILISGFTQNPELVLAAADFLCLPSHREGFGMVILEAAAFGIPAIGTNIYGISDAIAVGQTGHLVPLEDVQALAEAITRWCEYPEERAGLGAAARMRIIADFEQKTVVARYVKFFAELFRSKV